MKRATDNRTLPIFTPDSPWKAPDTPPNYRDVKVLGVDCETRDEALKADGPGFIRRTGSQLMGVSLCPQDGEPIYVPLHHPEDNVEYEPWMRWLRDVLGGPSQKVGANILYDVEALWSEGITLGGQWRDVQLVEALLDEERPDGYSLDVLAKHYLGHQKDEALLRDAAQAYGVDPKGGLWMLPARYVGPYAEQDARLPPQILREQLYGVSDQGQA